MSTTTVISTVDNITLVTLQDCPANAVSIAKVFDEISQCGINIDMISMAPTTIADEDLIGILGFTSKLKRETDIDVIVSSVNHKISVYDTAMRNTPGIAAQVFNAISGTDADIRLITTSEVEISLLVTEADFDTVLGAIQKAMA